MRPRQLWWQDNSAERYWLESTDRPDIGANLKAPAADASGRTNWRYTLFREANIDDIVYHYDVRQSAITSWSRVAGLPEELPIVWAARGSYARERGAQESEVVGYLVPLNSHSRLRQPLTLEALRSRTGQIKAILQKLPGKTRQAHYFPFELSERRPLRLLQGYAFKLPAEFVAAFPQLLDPRPPTVLPDTDWTDAEIAICIEGYAEMLGREAAGVAVNGNATTREIRDRLPTRSEGALIRRLQSISTVLVSQGREPLRRFAPREQVGRGMEKRIANLLDEIQPTADPDELDRRTRRARTRLKDPTAPPPAGSIQVITVESTVVRFRRRADVRAWVLNISGGTCEGCQQPASFTTDDGEPYLEVHHVRPLVRGGPDTTDNAIAICPTCHRRLHFSQEREAFRAAILKRIRRLVDYPDKPLPTDAEIAAGQAR
jgi:5-methylcytosine-specific restriction protein A